MKERDWYAPNQIHFSKSQVLWLMQNIAILRCVEWPPEHKVTGYTGGKSSRQSSAPYEKIAQVTAELQKRLEKCGQDGLLCELVYSEPDNYTGLIQHIANAMNLKAKTVRNKVNTARRYISGKCPKWIACPGAGKCVECSRCNKLATCTRLPRFGRSYDDFKRHMRGDRRS